MCKSFFRIVIQCFLVVLLISVVVSCTSVPDGNEPTTIITQVSSVATTLTSESKPVVIEPTATINLQVTTVTSNKDGVPARNPAQNTTLSNFITADFSGAEICASCHINLVDKAGADVSMPTAWRSTMMGNAAKDPVWQA